MVKPLLKKVLADMAVEHLTAEQLNHEVGEMTLDSRQVKPGGTFVAVAGQQTDGRKFISAALEAGGGLVIADADQSSGYRQNFENNPKVIWISGLAHNVSKLAANYYDNPSHGLKTIGVTGTNGKTSCSFLIAKTLQKLHFECYLLGTLGVGQSGRLRLTENTTTDAITMQRVFAEALDVGAQFVSMEVSSHGLDQSRAAAVKFHTVVFTNLTHDHLDYHGSMENYGEAKRKLFLSAGLENAVINMDDRFGRKLAKDPAITANKWLVTTKSPSTGTDLDHWVWAEEVVFSFDGIHAKVYTPWGSGKLSTPLIGAFNLTNLLLVIAALGSVFKDLTLILEALKSIEAASGRMQKIANQYSPLAIVDYAHTPDALEKSLLALREHCVGMIWCVFGCGGDRDSSKRPLMARVAEKLANRVVVTTDNPRTESPQAIREAIFSGFRNPQKIHYIEDRTGAIEFALGQASIGDAVLIAGKGHEDYQIIGVEKHHLSDIEIVTRAIDFLAPQAQQAEESD